MVISTAWAASVRYFFSTSTWRHMGAQLARTMPQVGVATGIIAGGIMLSNLGVHTITWLLHLPPPLLAIISSPLYVPPLLQLYEATDKRHAWGPYIMSGLLLYGSCTGLYLLFTSGPVWARWGFGVLGVLALPLLLALFIFSPIAALAYAYPPMTNQSAKKIWLHAVVMTVAELPFICLLLACTAPFGVIIYMVPTLLVQQGIVPSHWWHPILHMGSVAYWQVGWAAFMVFYQQQKHRYIQK